MAAAAKGGAKGGLRALLFLEAIVLDNFGF